MAVSLSVALVFGMASATMTGACTDDLSVAPASDDAGGEGGAVERASCPKDPVADGTTCLLPEGTTCSFGQCGDAVAQCTRGAWRYSANPSPKPPCPDIAPSSGATCPPCWPVDRSCVYGSSDCSLADASPNTAVATCGPATGGVWKIDIRPCRDGGDGGSDAGADVQGDGEPGGD